MRSSLWVVALVLAVVFSFVQAGFALDLGGLKKKAEAVADEKVEKAEAVGEKADEVKADEAKEEGSEEKVDDLKEKLKEKAEEKAEEAGSEEKTE